MDVHATSEASGPVSFRMSKTTDSSTGIKLREKDIHVFMYHT